MFTNLLFLFSFEIIIISTCTDHSGVIAEVGDVHRGEPLHDPLRY